MKYQTIAILAFSTLLPATAAGQFTAHTPPPRPRADSVKPAPTPAQRAAAADSMAQVTITNMKAWVDSAAGDIVVNRGVDSAGRPIAAPGPVTSGATAGASTSVFRDGAPAPDTATNLPLLVLVGTSAIGIGLVLVRWRLSA